MLFTENLMKTKFFVGFYAWHDVVKIFKNRHIISKRWIITQIFLKEYDTVLLFLKKRHDTLQY